MTEPAIATPSVPTPPTVPMGPQQETSPVYDARNKRVVDATSEQIAANPARFEAVGNQKVYMVGPDGQPYTVGAGAVDQALQNGWSFAAKDAVAHHNEIEAYAAKHSGGFDVGVHSMANQLLMGAPEAIEDEQLQGKRGVLSTGESNTEIEGRRLATQRNKAASYIGGGIGFGLNAAVGAGLGSLGSAGRAGEALAGGRSLAEEVAATGIADGKAAATAVADAAAPGFRQGVQQAAWTGVKQGAAMSAPQAVAQASFGDYDHAAESLLWGAGVGGLIGTGSGLFSEGVGALGGKAQAAAKAKLGELGALDAGGNLDLQKLGLASQESAQKMRAEAASALSEHAGILDKEIARAKPQIELPGFPDAGKSSGLQVVPTDLASTVQNNLLESRPGLKLPGFDSGLKGDAQEVIRKIAAYGDKPISFGELQNLRSAVTDGLTDNSARGRLLKQVDNLIQNTQTDAMGNAYAKLHLSTHYGDYLDQLGKLQGQMGMAADLSHPAVAQTLASWGINTLGSAASGAVGNAVGGVIGGPAGAFIGYKAIQPIIGKVLDHALTDKALTLSTGVLRKLAGNPETAGYFGAALAKDVSAAAVQKLSEIPTMLATKAAASNMPDPIRQFLGMKSNGLSKDQQYQAVVDKLTAAKANPDQTMQQVQAMGNVLGFDPRIQSATAQKQLQTLDVLNSAVPRNPNPPPPFQKDNWTPGAADKRRLADTLEVAYNPFSVMEHIRDGSASPAHMAALGAIYPTLRDQMVQQVARMAADPRTQDLSPGVKTGLSNLTGVNLNNYQNINFQGLVYGGAGPQGPAPQPGGKHHRGGSVPKPQQIKISIPSISTSSQRRADK